MISFDFNTELQIFEVKYSDTINYHDILEFGEYLYTNKELPRKLKIITDATEAKYELNTEEINKIVDSLKIHVTAYEYIKAAYIQNKPRETAYSMLLSTHHNIPHFYHAVFSSRDMAIQWLFSENKNSIQIKY